MEDTAPGMFAAITSEPVSHVIHSRDIQDSWTIAKQMAKISGGLFTESEIVNNISLRDANFEGISKYIRELFEASR